VLSRRSLIGSLASSPLLASPGISSAQPDSRLRVLGHQFLMAAAEIDRAVEGLSDLTQETMDTFDRIEAQIIATPATTIEGLRVKARAACWALLGDLDSGDQSSTDKSMARSIVRDLIRMYDPDLERPGALKKLVEDIENGASQ
jgi:hypothetical protein